MTKSNDINQHQRIAILDQMRGVALLAIFLANIPGLAEINKEHPSALNEGLNDVLSIILTDSARPLFAFMFGMSLMLIYNRLKEKDMNPYPILLRRFFLLAIVGVVHGYAIWAGDILLMYAMAGFVLLLFTNLSARGLMIAAVLFWLGYTVGTEVVSYFLYGGLSLEDGLKSVLVGSAEPFKGTEYLIIEFSSMVEHLGFFLFGMFAFRKSMFTFISKRRKQMWGFTFLSLVIGLTGKTVLYYNESIQVLNGFFPFVVTIGMILLIVLWGTSDTAVSKALIPFNSIGKMAFTNYLLQSLVFVCLFRESGRTIFEDVGIWTEPSYIFALSIGILLFVSQMLFSYLWLKQFRYGPFEWLWRMGTYWSFVSIKKKK
ncbi:hypothetical protein DH09_16895 [Bacillaceae bacterium JMAK1]|nr:hypothetical protein DH09_16895 [Bacillaceae bacterium JMAK1]